MKNCAAAQTLFRSRDTTGKPPSPQGRGSPRSGPVGYARKREFLPRRKPAAGAAYPTPNPPLRGGSAAGPRGLERKALRAPTLKATPIGALSRRFVLELPVETPDGFGGVIRTYAAGPELAGAIQYLGGGERFRADRAEQAATHRVTLRYRAGVTAAMRLTLGTRCFAIRAASDPDGSGRELVCLVEEVGP